MQAYMEFAQRVSDSARRERVVMGSDVSGSMRKADYAPSRIGGAASAIAAMIETKAREYPQDEIALVTFCQTASILQPPAAVGAERASLEEAAGRMAAGGQTNMTAGLERAGELLDGRGPAAGLGGRLARLIFGDDGRPAGQGLQRRVILLTDGCHNHGPSPRKIATQLKDAGTVIDCVGIGGSPREVDEKLLKALASPDADGKPRYRFIGDKQGLIRTYQRLAGRIRPA